MTVTTKHKELLDALEALVDTNNLSDVLAALAEVADYKADHLAANWQDRAAAKDWRKAADRIDNCAHTAAIVGVSY